MCAMEACIQKIRRWMISDKLVMNIAKKTEFIISGTRQQLINVQQITYSTTLNNSSFSLICG
jgi:hypothetical protein